MLKRHLLQKQKEKINGEKVIYHGRAEGGLSVIPAHKCKHDKAYVYASNNIALCIIFSVKRKGENIDFGVNFWGKTYITEFYNGGLEDRFKNRKCYLYKLPANKFKFETEYIERVSEEDVPVIDVLEIDDACDYLLSLEKQGKLKIYRYKDMNIRQKEFAHAELIKRLKSYKNFEVLTKQKYNLLTDEQKQNYNIKKERYDFCMKKFPSLMEDIKNNKI